jgi:pilus assembly protein Flp/PilA
MSRFFKNNSGATAIEYALIAGLITVGVITALTSIGTTLNGTFNSITSVLP